MTTKNLRVRVGEIRPSQIMFTYGIGAIIDLPKLSVIVTGLEDWRPAMTTMHPIVEDRLLMAIRYVLPGVKRLLTPPSVPNEGLSVDPFDNAMRIGVPVAPFPRWMVCPQCRMLAPLSSGLFQLQDNLFHPDRTVYRHENCNKGNKPEVIPVRFLVACEAGHLDDFPWVEFVHQETPCDSPSLRLFEFGPSGEARDLEVRCVSCDSKRRMAEAFGQENRQNMPRCKGRRPQLRDYDPEGCKLKVRPITLGQSNTWFPVVLSTLAIPVESGKLAQLVNDNWARLQAVSSIEVLKAFRAIGQLGGDLLPYTDDQIMGAIVQRQQSDSGTQEPPNALPDLKEPEWQVFTQYAPELNGDDFWIHPVKPPERFKPLISQVMLVERLREVSAMVGFTRIDSINELTEPGDTIAFKPAPISRQKTQWVPANEIHGEGIFIQFDEDKVAEWLNKPSVRLREYDFLDGHKKWRTMRRIHPPENGYPGMRYVLLHTFSHVLMRQLVLECGYAAASIRERLYSRPANSPGGPMAGVLIYTSAPDSEGTLGGLVSLGEPSTLEQYISKALEAAQLCASDPICAERSPNQSAQTLHAAACHACLFAPETSCERGNKYLDRSVITVTMEHNDLAFFDA